MFRKSIITFSGILFLFVASPSLAQHAKTPVIKDVKTRLVKGEGGKRTVELRATVLSNAPLESVSLGYTPPGSTSSIGTGVSTREIKPGVWEATFTEELSEWAPEGTFKFEWLRAKNEGNLSSEDYTETKNIDVTIPAGLKIAKPPIIKDVKTRLVKGEGGKRTVELRATVLSNAPLESVSLGYTPPGSTSSIGTGASTREIKPGVWEATFTEELSEWAPEGTFKFEWLRAKNEGNLSSEDYAQSNNLEVKVPVTKKSAKKPLIKNVKTRLVKGEGGKRIVELRATVLSNAPLESVSLGYTPPGSTSSIGTSASTREVKPGVWEAVFTQELSKWTQKGAFKFEWLRAENVGNLSSEDYTKTNNIDVEVKDEAVTKQVASKKSFQIVNVGVDNASFKSEIKKFRTRAFHHKRGIRLNVEVEAETRPDRLYFDVLSPDGNIVAKRGLEKGAINFTKNESTGRWSAEVLVEISDYAKSGDYQITNVQVESSTTRMSSKHTEGISIPLKQKETPRGEPKITRVLTNRSTIPAEGGSFRLIVEVMSEVPISALHYDFSGPNGKLESGKARFRTGIEPGKYVLVKSFDISAWAAEGNYTVSKLVVETEAGTKSLIWKSKDFNPEQYEDRFEDYKDEGVTEEQFYIGSSWIGKVSVTKLPATHRMAKVSDNEEKQIPARAGGKPYKLSRHAYKAMEAK